MSLKKTYTCIYHFWYWLTFSVVGRILNDVVNRLPNLENKKDTKDLQARCSSAAHAQIVRYGGYTCWFLCRKWLSASWRQLEGLQGHPLNRPAGWAAAWRSKFGRRCILKQKSLMTQMWMETMMVTLDFHDHQSLPHLHFPYLSI